MYTHTHTLRISYIIYDFRIGIWLGRKYRNIFLLPKPWRQGFVLFKMTVIFLFSKILRKFHIYVSYSNIK